MLTTIQTQRNPVAIQNPFLSILAGSLCPTCGQATVCTSCHRCHYCEDVDLPCSRSHQTTNLPPRRASLLFANHNDSSQEQQSTELVEPDIPVNFDDLTDEQLEQLIRDLIAQAAVLYHSGAFIEESDLSASEQRETVSPFLGTHIRTYRPGTYGGQSVTPIACRASRFKQSQKGGAK